DAGARPPGSRGAMVPWPGRGAGMAEGPPGRDARTGSSASAARRGRAVAGGRVPGAGWQAPGHAGPGAPRTRPGFRILGHRRAVALIGRPRLFPSPAKLYPVGFRDRDGAARRRHVDGPVISPADLSLNAPAHTTADWRS